MPECPGPAAAVTAWAAAAPRPRPDQAEPHLTASEPGVCHASEVPRHAGGLCRDGVGLAPSESKSPARAARLTRTRHGPSRSRAARRSGLSRVGPA